MEKKMVYWLKFYSPNVFVADTENVEVDELPAPENVAFPDDAYCFEMYKREDVIDGKSVYMGKAEQVGFTYYHPNSKVETLEQVKRNPKATNILITNMQVNEWNKIVWTRWGNFPQPFDGRTMRVL